MIERGFRECWKDGSLLVPAVFFGVIVSTHLGCGSAGTSDDSLESFGGGSTVIGSISSQAGNQADMQGWVIVLLDKATEIARVAEVNAAGLFSFAHVDKSSVYTLVLISPTYIVSSVLAHPGTVPNSVHQYFKITSNTLPRLIHKGPIITLQNEDGIVMQKDRASDVNGDLIPDGIANVIGIELTNQFGLVENEDSPQFPLLLKQKSTADIDTDGIRNIEDPDIDGDGLANVFDSEDDGDQLYDIFDLDSDGDAIVDSTQMEHDLYFPIGVEWVSVKYEMIPNAAGTFEASLTFFTKLRSNSPTPKSVSIRGAPYLLNNTLVSEVSPDDDTLRVDTAWDRLLKDDGKSEDAAGGDLLFARKIKLDAGKIPSFHQVVFFQLAYGSGSDAWFMEFPYTFPPITPTAIKASYSKLSNVILLSGNPFGDIQDFLWTASIYDPEGIKIYTSEETSGTKRTLQLPTNILEGSTKYTYKVTAQVLDRVPGYVNYTIDSATAALE